MWRLSIQIRSYVEDKELMQKISNKMGGVRASQSSQRCSKKLCHESTHIWSFSGILLYHSFTAGTSSRNQHAPSPDASPLHYFSFRSSFIWDLRIFVYITVLIYIIMYIFLKVPCQLNLLCDHSWSNRHDPPSLRFQLKLCETLSASARHRGDTRHKVILQLFSPFLGWFL